MLDRVAVAVLTWVLLLAACGGSKSTPTTPTTTSTPATSCSTTVTQDPATKTLASAAGTFTVTVTTGAGCAWTAVANDGFLSVTSGASGTGSGTVQVAVSANTGAERTGTLTIGGVTVTVTQTSAAAAACAFSVTPTSASIPASGGDLTFSVTVTQGANCFWTAGTSDPSLSVKTGASGTGNGTVVLTAGANTGGNRTATATIAGQAVTISQLAAGCAFTVSASSTSIPAGGGDVTLAISMTQGAACTWTVASTDAFVTVKNGGSGTGSGNAVVTLAANTGANRTASISVAGQTIVISQAGVSSGGGGGGGTVTCVFAVTSSTTSVPASGGDVQLTVTTPQGSACMWTVLLSDAFVTIKSGVPTTGNGAAVVTLAPNSGASRTTSIVVAGQTIVISQAGGGGGGGGSTVACAFTVMATPTSVPASGGDVQLTITNTQGSACTWTATVSSAFVTIVSGATGTGNGTAVARFAPNTSAARTATITVTGQTVVVSQAANTCLYNVSPGDQSVGAASQSLLETVSVPDSTCSWTATTTAAFLTVSPSSGTSNGIVAIQIAANPGAARTGSVTIAGKTFTITQGDGGAVVILSYRSQQGDFIGGGQTQTRTSAATAMQALTVNASHSEIDLASSVTGSQFWSLHLTPAFGSPLVPGFYDDTARWPFQPASQPGLDLAMDGRGCDHSYGRFLVGEAVFSGTTIQRFHAVFEQHCEYASAGIIGDIWIDAAGSTSVPPLALPPTPGSPMTFFSAQSAVGDPIGGGQSVSYALGNAVFTPSVDPQHVQVSVLPPTGPSFFWYLDFAAPAGQNLAPGTYLNAARWPGEPAGVPGLSVMANGLACTTVTGQFSVLEIQYDTSGALLRFHATFVQYCAGSTAALTGEIYIVANPWR